MYLFAKETSKILKILDTQVITRVFTAGGKHREKVMKTL